MQGPSPLSQSWYGLSSEPPLAAELPHGFSVGGGSSNLWSTTTCSSSTAWPRRAGEWRLGMGNGLAYGPATAEIERLVVRLEALDHSDSVSYTHLTLPTNREV